MLVSKGHLFDWWLCGWQGEGWIGGGVVCVSWSDVKLAGTLYNVGSVSAWMTTEALHGTVSDEVGRDRGQGLRTQFCFQCMV